MAKQEQRQMALTAELTSQLARAIADPGLGSDMVLMTDKDYKEVSLQLLSQAPSPESLWLFAYGSLLWNPACVVAESRPAVVRGWHRAFCFKVTRFRGTPDRPGLVMALDRGGQCRGMLLRLPSDQNQSCFEAVLRRELPFKSPSAHTARWLTAHTSDGPLRALGFVVDRQGPRYAGRLHLDEVASVLAVAAGHRGSGADYLRETVACLERLEIHDRNLWRLQELVARKIKAGSAL